ncbi:protein NATD1-like [Copidosoma floridanum]|uniref:protein NATD1-like n=1 Tax=Copidosoma floridanum TaxID=29053 RepID=UPI000C6F761B|nr:protein NATD1-like [Copidosoma floridanum]
MIFRNVLGFLGSGFRTKLTCARSLHEVRHNLGKNVFYVVLDETYNKKAVLIYKIRDRVMDLRAINVPPAYKGRGLARLLTETAFTYAIINDYLLFLTCSYTQKYYLANKNPELTERVVGPKSILGLPVSLDPETFEEEADPEDSLPSEKKP